MDKVSIIIPIYNGEKYLKRCLDSILAQTYENIELVCVNDGSKDGTLDILKEYQKNDSRVIIIDKKNTGVSDSRNLGIKKSTGQYIAFCDADDMYEKNYIEKLYTFLTKKNVDAVRCNFRVIDENDNQTDKGDLSELNNKTYSSEKIKKIIIPMALNGKWPCFSYLIFVKKEKVKNIKFPTDIHMMEDVVFYLNLLLNLDNIFVTNECLYTIMYNQEGATNSVKNYERNILNIIDVNKYIVEILKNNYLFDLTKIKNLNFNHLNAISDFIFKTYLYDKNKSIDMCKNLSLNKYFIKMIDNVDLNNISIERKLILRYIRNQNFKILKYYLNIRKIIYKLKRL